MRGYSLFFGLCLLQICTSFTFTDCTRRKCSVRDNGTQVSAIKESTEMTDRGKFLKNIMLGTLPFILSSQPSFAIPEQKSYSSNARNLDRLSSGDSSGGSVYNNNPTSTAAAKRRAMLGCKTDASRKQAIKMEGFDNSFSEKDCNLKVMAGETEFMLKALRELDCPTCPYGIKGA